MAVDGRLIERIDELKAYIVASAGHTLHMQ